MRKSFFALCLVVIVPMATAGTLAADEPGTVAQKVKKCMESLDSDDLQVRLQAAKELARLGEKAEPAIPRLIQALGDRSEDMKVQATLALRNIGLSGHRLSMLRRFAKAMGVDVRELLGEG